MKKRLFLLVLFSALVAVQAQTPPQQMKAEDVKKALDLVSETQPVPEKFKIGFDSITDKDMLAVLSYVSSDGMEGRETTTKGFSLAADYVISLYKLWGIKPGGDKPVQSFGRFMFGGPATPPAPQEKTYLQNLTLKQVSDVKSSMSVEVKKGDASKIKTFVAGVDYTNMGSSAETLSGSVVFLGYGIKEPAIGWDELKGQNIKDKIVLVLSEAPGKDDPKSPFQQKKEIKEKYFPATPGGDMMAMRMRGMGRFNKLDEINKLGPAAILVVQNMGKDADFYNNLSQVRKQEDDKPIINKPRQRLSIPGAAPIMFGGGSPSITITREMANAILEASGETIDGLKKKIDSAYKPASHALAGVRVTISSTSKVSLVRAANVIGYIEGSDPKLKDEVFVVGAHFDHLGAWGDYVYNGSDDNGSGSVGVMFIARAMAQNPVKPKRTVVFCLWCGEEEGLLGSRYYVQNPPFPIEKTVGYLNYDMISRANDEQSIARQARMLGVPGAEDLVKKIRAPKFISVNLTKESGFSEIERDMNKYVGLDLYLREAELGQGGGGSDHSSFAMAKIPFVYYMTAMHSDYHLTGDTTDKASGDLFAKVTKLGYLTTFAFADK